MSNYEEIFCQATEILANNLINKVSYDKTILCTIINDSEKELGKYRVSNGEANFDAYTTGPKYHKGNSVYVQIPNGDWNEQKFIVSKKVDNENIPITYLDPFDSYVDITNNVIATNLGQSALKANDTIESIVLWTYNEKDNSAIFQDIGKDFNGYTRLGIRGSFQTWLNDLNTAIGNYGLKLTLYTETESSEVKDDNAQPTIQEKICILDCYDMIGNPYNFDSYYVQKKLFDITDIKAIKKMKLEFFQDKGSFKDKNGIEIPCTLTTPPNLFVKDIIISLGYDAQQFENDTVILYTPNSQKYSKDKNEVENHKKLYVRWIHKFDDIIKVVDENDNIDYQLKWYRHILGQKSDTVWSGVDWAPLSSEIKTNGKIDYDIKDKQWLSYNQNSLNASRHPSFGESWLLPDITKAEEKIKVVITYGDEVLYSNILNFSNSYEVVSKPTVDAVQALSIYCEDGDNDSYGNYLIYDLGGKILNHADSMIERKFIACFNSTMDEIDDNEISYLTEAESIEWVIPTVNSMIVIDDSFIGENATKDAEGNYHIFYYGTPGTNDITHSNTQRYKIRSYYSQTYNNNTIKCIVTRNNITYTAVKELTFGPAGTSGTDYTFVLDFEGNTTALTIGDNKAVIVKAMLYDYEGKEITDLENKYITWSLNYETHITHSAVEKQENNKIITIANKQEIKLKNGIDTVPIDNFAILKATLHKQGIAGDNGWGDYDLEAYLPIPIRLNKNYSFISGATTIVYNSLGYLDSYFQNPYSLYYIDVKAENPQLSIIPGEWICYSKNENDPFKPKLDKNIDGKYVIRPTSFYAKDKNSDSGLCIVSNVNGTPVWSQPIFVTQNKYPSSIVNKWNGKLTIDNKNNTILSAKVVAGKKEDDNTFSGVMMGDWSGNDGRSSVEKPFTDNTGIYGFQKGVASFGFRDDGTAFIGKPGKGRLEFNGNKSIITSNSFADKLGGMSLDFDKGKIELYEPEKVHSNKKSIIINADASDKPFKIGTKFWVEWDGTIHASNGIFSGTINSSKINGGTIVGSSIYIPKEKNWNFSVTSDGLLTAEGADITGKITSEEGQIGGWYIGETTLSSAGVILNSSDGSITGATIKAGTLSSNSDTDRITLNGYLSVSDGILGHVTTGIPNVNADGIGMSCGNCVMKVTSANVGMNDGVAYVACYNGKVDIGGDKININIPKDNQSGIYARFA